MKVPMDSPIDSVAQLGRAVRTPLQDAGCVQLLLSDGSK